jgi:hypothetical protein
MHANWQTQSFCSTSVECFPTKFEWQKRLLASPVWKATLWRSSITYV